MKVVLLLGPSSAGKSTLCDALVNTHGWHTHGGDKVGEIIQKERGPRLEAKLQEKQLFQKLTPFMTKEAVLKLALTGQLELTQNNTSIVHQFSNPDFKEAEAVLSRAQLPHTTQSELAQLLHEVGDVSKSEPMPNGLLRMMEDIFTLPEDASVIIDQVPPTEGDVQAMIEDFKTQLDTHAKAYNQPITFALILAFYPPQGLSERIHARNAAAVRSGDLSNKREGAFPFFQLSQLITATEAQGDEHTASTLSKMQLLLIALNHLPPGVTQTKTEKAKTMFKAGAHEYRALMQQFRLSGAEKVTVSPREDLGAHAIIDLSEATPTHELALALIEQTKDAPPLSVTPIATGKP